LLRRLLEKDVGPRIDEEADIASIGRLPSALDTTDLIDCLAEVSIRWKAVLKITTHSSRVDNLSDGLANNFKRVTITAFQIARHEQLRRAHYPPQILHRPG